MNVQSKQDSDANELPPEANDAGAILVRQLTDEQLATYRETGVMPPSDEIPLVRVTTVEAVLQASGEPTRFNGPVQKKL